MQVIIDRRVRRRVRRIRLLFRLLLICLVLISAACVALLSYTKMQGPPPLNVTQSTVFFGADNSVIGERHDGQRRYWVDLGDISQTMIDATLSIEDRRFYKHLGFDPQRIGGAVIANLKSGGKSQGASTITQQYARNLYLTHEKTWQRKWNELLYSLRLEMNYDKDDILEGYLNTVYYGHGAYGVEAAAQHFFGKSAKQLTLAEASMLAGIPKGPSYYSPFFDLERAKKRQGVVLQSMVTNGKITQAEADVAHSEQLAFTRTKLERPARVGPYFQDTVEELLIEEAGLDPALLKAGGLKIYTTLDPQLQKKAEALVTSEMPKGDLQTALAAIDPRTGDVKALIGGKNYEDSPYNRATKGKRAPGSSFKPFLYYAALENGYTAASTLLSEETTFTYDDGRATYSPSNYMDLYANDFITLLQAIAFSDNIYAVKTHLLLGTDKLVELAKRVGIESPLREIPSLALGTMPVDLLEMTGAYSTFANGGRHAKPRFIRKVIDAEGQVLYETKPNAQQVLDPKLTFILTDLMTAMFDPSLNAHISVTGGSITHLLDQPAAGKSGSTSTDSWMIGYTPKLVTGVWVGYDKGQTLNNQTEGQLAKQIWANFIKEAHEGQTKISFPIPAGVTGVEIDPKSGLLATAECPQHRVAYFVEGTEPTKPCTAPTKNGDDVEINEAAHEKERFLKKFFKWLHPSKDPTSQS